MGQLGRLQAGLKRMVDVLVAIIELALLSPLMAGVAVAIRVVLGSPVLFTQQRPGYRGEPFVFYKFRTMTNETDPSGHLLPDEKRLTRLGKRLRRLSLDELPQLFSVLKGDMSLVGPRPLLMEYMPLYTARQSRRHEVKPGVTGWAQVNGRNALTWEEKFDLDLWYVENQSILVDLRILVLTLVSLFRAKGISQDGHVTMSRFTGNVKSGSKHTVGR